MYSRGRRGAPAKGVGRVTGARVQISPSPPKNSTSFDLSNFFIHCESNGISSRISVYLITEGVYHQPQAVLCFRNDDIHAYGVMKARKFKSISKQRKISFLSALHKNRQVSTEACRFLLFHSSLFTFHFSLKPLVDFWQVISNSE